MGHAADIYTHRRTRVCIYLSVDKLSGEEYSDKIHAVGLGYVDI